MSSTTPLILIIEDHPVDSGALETILKDEFSVLCVTSVAEGVEKLEELEGGISVVILSLDQMEGIPHPQLLVHLFKQTSPETEVIVSSDKEELLIGLKSLNNDIFAYLTKPIDKKDARITVARACHYHNSYEQIKQGSSHVNRLMMLEQKRQVCRAKAQSFTMEDVYEYFPDLKQVGIPEGLVLTDALIDYNLDAFVASLYESVYFFNPNAQLHTEA
jgi:DNA-binding NtrC family response regulator